MNHNVEQYRQIQALADRRTMGQRRADVEAWRKPPARRHDDIGALRKENTRAALAYTGLWAICIGITLLFVTVAGQGIVEAIRGLS
jgi:hypothetical protein